MIREHLPFNEERAMWFVPFVGQFSESHDNIHLFWFHGYIFVHETNLGEHNQYFRLIFPIDNFNTKQKRVRAVLDLENEIHKYLDGKWENIKIQTIAHENFIHYSFIKITEEEHDKKEQRGYNIDLDSTF